MPKDYGDLKGKVPLYAVLFDSSLDPSALYQPYITASEAAERDSGEVTYATIPHGLAREIAAALPGLWYCTHLPNIFSQLSNASFQYLKVAQWFSLAHRFFFAPVQVFSSERLSAWPEAIPVLAVAPDEIIEVVRERAEDLGFAIPAASYSELSNASLVQHWKRMHEIFTPDEPYRGNEPKLTRRLDISPTSLPQFWLERQLSRHAVQDSDEDPASLIRKARQDQAILARYARSELSGQPVSGSTASVSEVVTTRGDSPRFPVTIALPGIASAYTRNAFSSSTRSRIEPILATSAEDTWSIDMHHRRDSMIERSAIELIATHRAIAQTGVGLMLPSVPRDSFIALANLERHFVDGPNGASTALLLRRLNEASSPIWTDALTEAIEGASSLTVFSNFPLGLLTPPGDSSPLSTSMPISYRPLNPLSQAMQRELTYTPGVNLSNGFNILVAECIPDSDPVGVASRAAWEGAKDFFQNGNYPITFNVVETLNISDLRTAIERESPAILVISAHGTYRLESNLAGLVIGDEICLGPELGDLPPVVLLSACHVAPRGAGAVSVSDLLLRQGALAVLGTQVPVNVNHNSILFTRFFVYLAETLAKRQSHLTLLEAWNQVQSSNAVMDILMGSQQISDWGLRQRPDGRRLVDDFMNSRSTDRISRDHVYRDTEQVLGEMADDEGIGPRVRGWFRRPGYVPESLFYLFIGMPERVYLRLT